jgi:hypothetical protein
MIRKRFNKDKIDFYANRIYGVIVVLSLIISLEYFKANSIRVIITILGTLFTFALAKVYIKYITKSMKYEKRICRHKFREICKEEFSIMLGSEIPLIPFILELINIISLETAFLLSKILGVIILFDFGYIFGKYMNYPIIKRLSAGLISAALGLIIVILKIIVK